eukprot:CAMPEP_0176454024 /NCGR_PEP_ID=MMETSP0127-20121128/29653_1 /TAXON_ID=938130 /ORGANISM="Platyophrya macrostoma, Strain WH" /LENGTH=60 /DNA_ID=CAMNT_0017843127 /DNA_START=1 /DNA_END=180 /DNA_ORIENTATION=-
MVTQMHQALDYWVEHENIKVCIWKGSGAAFCAGGDLVVWRSLGENKQYEMMELVHWLCAT